MVSAPAVAFALAASTAWAQASPPGRDAASPPPHLRFLPNSTVREDDLPLYFSLTPGTTPAPRPVPPLSPAQAASLRHAVDLLLQSLPERARDTLAVLARQVPHHPAIVTATARVLLARNDYPGAVTLLHDERIAQHDSTLASRELALCLERLAKPRDAAQVAVETWSAAPWEGGWAMQILLRLLPQDARGISEVLRSALARQPGRGDLARGFAVALARQGQPAEAARVLAGAERPGERPALRQWFADEALFANSRPDSLAAYEALASLAADSKRDPGEQLHAAQRALELAIALKLEAAAGPRLAKGLENVPGERWNATLLAGLARVLRETDHAAEAQALLSHSALAQRVPELMLEKALGTMREGPPARAIPALDSLARSYPPARFELGEAEFFAGRDDSALVHFKQVAEDVQSPDAIVALERTFLLEEKPGAPELATFGRLAWERWRGAGSRAVALADSLHHALPLRSPFYATAALQISELRAEAKNWTAALAPLAMVADSLPGDRLAPLARQRLGETFLKLGDDRRAVAAFEDCLARYPRAWNSAAVRRQLEQLRRDRHL